MYWDKKKEGGEFWCQLPFINKDLEMQRLAKTNDKNRRFGVIMTPLSRRNKNEVCGKV